MIENEFHFDRLCCEGRLSEHGSMVGEGSGAIPSDSILFKFLLFHIPEVLFKVVLVVDKNVLLGRAT
jgi:hypothetical protein